MTENQQRDILGEKLATFGISPLEAAVLASLGEKSPRTLSEIQKHTNHTIYGGRMRFHQCLKRLNKKGWISKTKTFPAQYSLVGKAQLQKNLEAIITTSQVTFQTQKKNYRSILKLLQNLETPATSIRSNISIPNSAPSFFKSFLEDISPLYNFTLTKIETNMVISLRRENIFFRLNAAEFEYQTQDHAYNCGIIFCMVDNPALLPTTIAKIHQYNANGLKFSYKLETKGYSDRKARELSEYSIEPPQSPSSEGDDEHKSMITLVTPKKTYTGLIETFPLPKNPLYCVSIWKETIEATPNFHATVMTLQNLKENDTALK